MKKTVAYLLFFYFISAAQAQDKPKLVVGIVVDQMRYDYLYTFASRYTANGFKRLLKEGFTFHDAHFNYVPTYTGPGHTSIYAGSTPSVHGIIANDWPDKKTGKNIYCTSDSTVSSVGTPSNAGKQSPHLLLSTNISDELRLASQKKSKVVGIALKDRSSIMPAGHMPNGAYWFDDSTGNWITSTFYISELPAWVKSYNDKKQAEKYLSQNWSTLFPVETYNNAWGDKTPYERVFAGEKTSEFPHPLAEIRKQNKGTFGLIKTTPFGCSITTELAIEAIKGEEMGKDAITDLLCISYSSPDYVGHYYGIRSIEMEDTYLRLDRELEALFMFLDKQVGKGQYTVFLTADHAAAENAQLLIDEKLPAGYFDEEKFTHAVNDHLIQSFRLDTTYILETINQQLYFNYSLMRAKGLDPEKVISSAQAFIMNYEGIVDVVSRKELMASDWSEQPRMLIRNGYFQPRSGDLVYTLLPGWMEYEKTGTTHGSHYAYDTHVPLIFMGKKIPAGSSSNKVNITDIAPTLSILLNIPYPGACSGSPLNEMLDKK